MPNLSFRKKGGVQTDKGTLQLYIVDLKVSVLFDVVHSNFSMTPRQIWNNVCD